jgi:hypothetical protein
MEQKTYECDLKEYTCPRLGLRHHKLVDKGLGNIFRELEEASKFANRLYPDNELDERFQKVFIELVTKKLQRHIWETVGKRIKPGNARSTLKTKIK